MSFSRKLCLVGRLRDQRWTPPRGFPLSAGAPQHKDTLGLGKKKPLHHSSTVDREPGTIIFPPFLSWWRSCLLICAGDIAIEEPMGHAHPGTDGVWGLCCGTSMCCVLVCVGLCCCVWGLQWALTAALDVCMCVCVCNAYEQMAALNYCHPALQAGPRCLCMFVCKCLYASVCLLLLWLYGWCAQGPTMLQVRQKSLKPPPSRSKGVMVVC